MNSPQNENQNRVNLTGVAQQFVQQEAGHATELDWRSSRECEGVFLSERVGVALCPLCHSVLWPDDSCMCGT